MLWFVNEFGYRMERQNLCRTKSEGFILFMMCAFGLYLLHEFSGGVAIIKFSHGREFFQAQADFSCEFCPCENQF